MPKRALPVLTIVTLAFWAVGTVLYHLGWTGLWHAVRRDPDALAHGQIWRLLSPVLVQPDPWNAVIGLAFLAFVVGLVAERAFTRVQWVILFLAGALAGHSIGELWQPYNSGISVGFCGLLGGLVAIALLAREPRERRLPQLIGPVLVLAGGIWLTVITDIHGPAILAGVVVGAVSSVARGGRAEGSERGRQVL